MSQNPFPAGIPAQFDRKVVITWPRPQNGSLRPCLAAITDADTGEPSSTVSKAVLSVHLDADTSLTWATVKAFANPDGTLFAHGPGKIVPTEPDGTVRSRVFAFEVTEMRLAERPVLIGGAAGHE